MQGHRFKNATYIRPRQFKPWLVLMRLKINGGTRHLVRDKVVKEGMRRLNNGRKTATA